MNYSTSGTIFEKEFNAMYFKDRYDAALKLIPRLKKYENEPGVVLAVPRGGIPIGYYIAKKYGFPLEVILVKKIGHPLSSELAVGAVGLEDQIINHAFDLSQEYLDRETERIRKTLHKRHKLFMGDRKPVDLKDKTVIIVDDGVATGNTMKATIQMIRTRRPKKIVIAVPVAPPETMKKLEKLADDFICLHSPDEFYGVGQFYIDFSEVSDEEAATLLNQANDKRQVA